MKNKKALIVKNFPLEGPGLIEQVLNENSIDYEIVELDKGEDFPNPLDYSAMFVLGGPDSANDQTAKIRSELERIRQATGYKIPYFGVCLGMQALVKANGGEVCKNPIKEIGLMDPRGNFFEISLTPNGMEDKIFSGVKSPMKIFQLHGETVKLTSGMELLAEGRYCINQAIKIGKNAYGFQGHLELNDKLFEKLIAEEPDLRRINTSSLREGYNALRLEYRDNGRKILSNFLELAGLK